MKQLCLICLLFGITVLSASPSRADQVPLNLLFVPTGSTEGPAFSFGQDQAFKAPQSSLNFTASMIDCNAPHLSWSPPASLFSVEFSGYGIARNQGDPVAAASQSMFSLGRITSDLISIPEPATITLLSLGLGLIGAKLSRARTKS